MRFTFIAAKRAEHTITILCRCLRVTRSGFYAWHGRAESTHARDDRRLKVLVQASFHESKQRYGSPRVHEDLIEQQERRRLQLEIVTIWPEFARLGPFGSPTR